MLNKALSKIFFAVAKTAVTVSLFTFLLFFLQQEYHTAKLRKLNNFAPSSYDYLLGLMEGQRKLHPARLEEYEHYYKMLMAYLPGRAEAYGMLGFCSYYLGKVQKAIFYYRKAVQLYPRFFWFHYNLGVLYLQNGEYDKALESLKAAQTTQARDTLNLIFSSKVYRPILTNLAQLGLLQENLQNGLQYCHLLQAAILQKKAGASFSLKDPLPPRIF